MSKKQPAKHKHIPQRMCVVCRQRREKRSLTRLIYRSDGLAIDSTGKADGRGVYLCDNSQCWDRAHKSKILDQALRVSLTAHDKQILIERQR